LKITPTTNGALIKIIVKPKSKNFKIQLEEENLLVYCRNAPEKGKVNKELMKELSRLLKHQVIITSGFGSKEKLVLVKDIEPEELERLCRNP
jgi:uncharacterized protein (TIGR00251 family)